MGDINIWRISRYSVGIWSILIYGEYLECVEIWSILIYGEYQDIV